MKKNLIFLIICFLFACSQNNNFNGNWIIEDEESLGEDIIQQFLNQKDIMLKADPSAEKGFEFGALLVAGITVEQFKDLKINDNKFLLGGIKQKKQEVKISGLDEQKCEIETNSNIALCDDGSKLDLKISGDNLLITMSHTNSPIKIKFSLKRDDSNSKTSEIEKQSTQEVSKNNEQTLISRFIARYEESNLTPTTEESCILDQIIDWEEENKKDMYEISDLDYGTFVKTCANPYGEGN